MEVEVKLPKPGDQLPFVVAEWEDGKYHYRAIYKESGVLGFECSQDKKTWVWGWNRTCQEVVDGLPESVPVICTVATTIEGGGE